MSEWKAGDHAKIPSGLGGVFIVRLIERRGRDRWLVRVDMPRNTDFHGEEYRPLECDLQEVDHG